MLQQPLPCGSFLLVEILESEIHVESLLMSLSISWMVPGVGPSYRPLLNPQLGKLEFPRYGEEELGGPGRFADDHRARA